MSTVKPVLLRLISSAVSVASKAGAEVRQITQSGLLGVVDKGHKDYQTKADREAQRLIVASLTKQFPKCKIVGEEELVEDKLAEARLLVDTFDEKVLTMNLPAQYVDVQEDEITIWVDPLDGTSEFVQGVYEPSTVLIGISINSKSVAGIINQPFHNSTGRTIWGLIGLGCFGIQTKPAPANKFIVVTTSSHGNKNINEAIDALKPDEVLRVGGAGYKAILLLEGKAHSYVFASSGCKRWDTSAPEAVLIAAGGHLTDILGKRIHYEFRQDRNYVNKLGLIASMDAEIQSRVLATLPASVKDRLVEAARQ